MDFRVIWSKSALADLRDLARYIARDNRDAARRFGNLIVDRALGLGQFPRRGRVVPEFGLDTVRQVTATPYRIVYEIDDLAVTVAILRGWHGARDRLDDTTLRGEF